MFYSHLMIHQVIIVRIFIYNKERLLKNKSNVSESTVKTYCSLLRSLFYKMNNPRTKFNPEFFEDFKQVCKLKDYKLNNRKTYLACIILFLGKHHPSIQEYSNIMMSDADIAKEDDENQTMNVNQRENSVSTEEISNEFRSILDKYIKISKINKNKELSKQDYKIWQNLIILIFCSCIFIPPRRLLDYSELKYKNI
jgi:hypothetical protein